MSMIRRIHYWILVLLLSSCGKGPSAEEFLPVSKDNELGPPMAPRRLEVNGILCPSAACPSSVFNVTSSHPVTIRGQVEKNIDNVISSDLGGTLDDRNFSDLMFQFTTSVGPGEIRTVQFRTVNKSGTQSDPTTVTLQRLTASFLTLKLASPPTSSAHQQASNGVTLKSFGTTSLAAPTAMSGSTQLDLGFSRVIGRMSP